jgi:hypothetical protein
MGIGPQKEPGTHFNYSPSYIIGNPFQEQH